MPHSLTKYLAIEPEDFDPALNLMLKVSQVATLENTTRQEVHLWVRSGYFPEYSRMPNKRGDVRIPLWSYLVFRRNQRVRCG